MRAVKNSASPPPRTLLNLTQGSFVGRNRRYAPGMSSLPARVRVSRLPLPIAPNVAVQFRKLLPGVAPESVTLAAAALAGGRVVGVGAVTAAGYAEALEAGWRGKGIEGALLAAVSEQARQNAVQPESAQPESAQPGESVQP